MINMELCTSYLLLKITQRTVARTKNTTAALAPTATTIMMTSVGAIM